MIDSYIQRLATMKSLVYLLALVQTAPLLLWLWVRRSGSINPAARFRTPHNETLQIENTPADKNKEKSRRRLLANTLVKERYLSVPAGFRNHPSYYSDSYLPRAQERSASELSELTQQWGSWTFQDLKANERPSNDFYNQFPNRDVPRDSFPKNAWQTDSQYLGEWFPQAISLVNRTLEAILSEYGQGLEHKPGESFERRAKMFMLVKDGPAKPPQKIGGWMNEKSYQGLKRRLLHALMSQDSFNIVMGGHSSSAGHGNYFQQSYTLQISRVLEPVFARLGVKMTARNMGMGGLGTLQNSMGASDIYGEDVDILMWDSSMTEKNPPPIGVFAVQGLLGSDRAPLLWFWQEKGILNTIHEKTGADIAVYGDGTTGFVSADTVDEMQKLPYAMQWVKCGAALKGECANNKFKGECWIDRGSDFSWSGVDLSGFQVPEDKKNVKMGGQAGWHPGWRHHQIVGRSYAFPILLALKEILEQWQSMPDFALPDSAWHVTEYYKSIQYKTRSNSAAFVGWCIESGLPQIFCKERAHARTENGPRNKPWATSIRSIMKGMPSPGLNPKANMYDPPDVHVGLMDPPKGEIDVLAIAENGIPFEPNLARIHDSALEMGSPTFSKDDSLSTKNPGIQPGRGWMGGFAGSDNCDGTYDSFCDRGGSRDCLLYGHNDHRDGLLFDGYSGWGVFQLKGMKHGTIVIKLHSWYFFQAPSTDGWCSENNKEPCTSRRLRSNSNTTTVEQNRRLKPAVPPYCDDFQFTFAVDGKVTTWDLKTWESKRKENERVVETWTLMEDSNFVPQGETKDVELAFRVTGCGRSKAFELTHIYWL